MSADLKKKFFLHGNEETFNESYLPLSFFLSKIWVHCPYCSNLAEIKTNIPEIAKQEKILFVFYDTSIPHFSPAYHQYTEVTFSCSHCQKHIKADHSNYHEPEFIKKYWWGPVQAYAKLLVCPHCHSREKIRLEKKFESFPQLAPNHDFICLNCQVHTEIPITYYREVLPSSLYDPIFGIPLWLVAEVKQHVLWLYNLEHLQIMRMYIAAKHHKEDFIVNFAQRSTYPSANTLTFSKSLPEWMKRVKNRKLILTTLNKLEMNLKKLL